MTIVLESMAVAMPEVDGHPNRAAFRGVLTLVDAASQRAPSGSGGRRVVLTKQAAEAALPSLLGMGLDYAPTFDRHDVRRKVGVITSADVVGRNLEVGGYLYAKDFPDIVSEIAKAGRRPESSELRGSASGLGPSGFQAEGGRLRASLSIAVEQLRSVTAAIRSGADCDALVPALRARAEGGASGELGMSFEVTNVVLAEPKARVWTLVKVTFTGAAILRKEKAAYQDTWIELES
jgi:hypothetical protein